MHLCEMPATLLFKHIHVYITNDLYNLNFIALDEKLTELDKLIYINFETTVNKFLENILV